MLLVGIILKNVPGVDVARDIHPEWASALRSVALAVILLRAGLGLDPAALRKLSAMVFRLAFSPCLAETLVVAVASHLLLDFPWTWGFMLGFVLAAVSPAVVVPCLLSLQVSLTSLVRHVTLTKCQYHTRSEATAWPKASRPW